MAHKIEQKNILQLSLSYCIAAIVETFQEILCFAMTYI